MSFITHVNYMYGAFLGAMSGSFLVHFGDTIAARAFSGVIKQDWWSTTKILFKSYIPVCIGVVPMRAASFGVYSVAQQVFFNYDGFEGKIIGGVISGISLVALSTPAEILKTKKQLELHTSQPWYRLFTLKEIGNNFMPLCFRIVPTVTCMLAGSAYIITLLNIDSFVVSTALASLMAAILSQVLATPFENMRIHRIQRKNYTTPTIDLINELKFQKIYKGFWYRGLSLGLQSSFTLIAAAIATQAYE